MNFFQSQAQARAHSRRLVVLFGLAVALIVAAVNAVVFVAVALMMGGGEDRRADPALLAGQAPQIVAVVTLVVGGIVALASFYKVMQLRAGGGAVARGLGAVPLASQPRDPRQRRLRNVVEEIAIASGVAVPEIYVLEGERAINAFAAGFSPADAAVTVTQAALEKLTRDELQGVIAHEFSHIVNGDMRLSIRLMGIVFGILALTVVARAVLRGSRRSRKGGGPIVLAALAVLVIGYIGVFFARLIKAGFSRQRESLADASAVQFTRQTQGLAGALKKIAGVHEGSHLQAAGSEEVSHMLFGEGMKLSSLFATHPPIGERIQALEPGFDLQRIPVLSREQRWNEADYAADFAPEDLATPVAGFAPPASAAAPDAPARLIGQPGPAHYAYAEALRSALPQDLRDLAHDPAAARHLVLGLLVDAGAGTRQKQLALIGRSQGEASARAVEALWPRLEALHPSHRLPLTELAFPALRSGKRAGLMELVALISRLSHVNGQVSVAEFCLGRMVRTQVADALKPAQADVAGRLRVAACEADVARLLSALAEHGSADAAAARRSYLAGLSHVLPRSGVKYQPGQPWPTVLDPALRQLDRLQGTSKEVLLEALVKTASHDGRITVGEAELLRVICASLHCPLPPLLD